MTTGEVRRGGLDVWAPSKTPPIGVDLTDEQLMAIAFRHLADIGFSENMAGHITWQPDGQATVPAVGLRHECSQFPAIQAHGGGHGREHRGAQLPRILLAPQHDGHLNANRLRELFECDRVRLRRIQAVEAAQRLEQ